jgi:hypothetical protein
MDEQRESGSRHRRSRAEALRLASEFEQSGLTRRAFCHQHGLSSASLDNYRRWRSRETGIGQSASDVAFVPVEWIERPSPAQRSSSAVGLYLELSNGRRIGVGEGFDAATLTKLITVLEQV